VEKLVYVIGREGAAQGAELREALMAKSVPVLRDSGARQISVNVADEHVAQGAAVTIRNSTPPVQAMVSFWLENSDDRAECEAALREHADPLAGYLVVESRPLIHHPPVGERAPGANLVTCIVRKAGLSDEVFIDRWNNEHRKVALEIQSTFSYVRNAVCRKLTPEARELDGVVEEAFPIEALTDPLVWYDCDSQEEQLQRVRRMVESVQAFLDLSRLDSVPMSEYSLG
jgi:hypothetical protein